MDTFFFIPNIYIFNTFLVLNTGQIPCFWGMLFMGFTELATEYELKVESIKKRREGVTIISIIGAVYLVYLTGHTKIPFFYFAFYVKFSRFFSQLKTTIHK